MAPRIAWLLNLDAELELRHARAYTPSPRLAERIGALVPRLGSLIDGGDRVVGRDADLGAVDVALAFSPTPSAVARLAVHGLRPPHVPDAGLLRELARRAFSASLGQCLPDAAYVTSGEALAAHLASHRGRSAEWLLKRDFSFAGRERLRVADGPLLPDALAFASRSFARGEGIQLEPWCARTLDASQHGYLTPGGALLVGAPQLQACDPRGVWQASQPERGELAALEREALATELARTGQALRARGYAGPFGIDGFRYTAGHGVAFCARCEVNARFTMAYPRALLMRALEAEGAPP